MARSCFALIDSNNFFVACEQIFRPDLHGKPVVVLSSNDGCAIARSAEAKALGIPMGAPAFKYKQLFREQGVVQFSANFELYGDISRRITEVLTSITPRIEVYSIDESFLDLSELDIKDYEAWGREVRSRIKQWTGVSVSIGIAPTKTLAKLASEYSKSHTGTCALTNVQKPQNVKGSTLHNRGTPIKSVKGLSFHTYDTYGTILTQVAVEDVWGVGRAMAPKLRGQGLATAQDIARLTPAQGRKMFNSVNGERLVRELQGQPCLPLEQIHKEQKMISATRTFGHDTSEAYVVEAAIASFVARAASRLRTQGLQASRLSVFLASDRHKNGYQKWGREVRLSQPTADTGYLTALANQLFSEFYNSTAVYHRGGVLLSDFSSDQTLQTDMLGVRDPEAFDASKRRMQAIDQLHTKYDKRIVRYASEDLALTWEPRRNIRSPRYTTHWGELPKVKI